MTNQTDYLQAYSGIYNEEKEVDVISCTIKGKYEALYLQTNRLRGKNWLFQCLDTTVVNNQFGLAITLK